MKKRTLKETQEYSVTNIGDQHARAWSRDEYKRHGLEAQNKFIAMVNSVNKKNIL